MPELKKPLIGLAAALIALAGAVVMKARADSEHASVRADDAVAASPPA